jgi:Flp pilus assembly protein CpaB
VLQDVPVLTVGERFQEESDGGKIKRHKVTVATLQVKPEEGERLGLISSEARLLLALRNQGDHEGQTTPGVFLTSIMPTPVAPAPPPPPPPAVQDSGPKVEVIKGIERGQQSLVPGEMAAKSKAKAAASAPAPPDDEPASAQTRPGPRR